MGNFADYSKFIGNRNLRDIFDIYNSLNEEEFHKTSSDDICTPMELVRIMIDSVPNELWERDRIRVLDPCCGNGNFGAYCKTFTNLTNIYFYDINNTRLDLCRSMLRPRHCENRDFFEVNDKFDLIMGNPPYSGGGNKNRSLSNLFIEHSIELLNDRGYLCFVTPNNWMTYNNNNTTLVKLLNEGSFIQINNDVKKYFPKVGSSFTVIIWQKGVFNNGTLVINNYLVKDRKIVTFNNDLHYIPLYISDEILSICEKYYSQEESLFKYRCDLHNFTQASLLCDVQNSDFKYETIHTARKTRYAKIKQDIYKNWLIIFPLSTYLIPYIRHNVNVTQSVGYMSFKTKKEATDYLKIINRDNAIKLIVHLTRYGNFNNIMVLKHMDFESQKNLSVDEVNEINRLIKFIKY